jgi:hypothetical protein
MTLTKPARLAPSRHLALTADSFARAFGESAHHLPEDARDLIETTDFSYQALSQPEREQVVLGVLQKIDAKAFQRVGEHRKAVWERGWQENLDAFADQGLESLVPRFMRASQIVRLNQQYVRVHNPKFELDFLSVLRRWLFRRYFASASAVYEFGCGSGYNLVALAELYPQCELCGLDWAETSVELVNRLGETHHLRLQGRRFDFFHPDELLEFGPGSMVLTMAALEQVGSRHGKFLEFLLRKRPSLVVNVEPLCELYDPNNLADYLAIRYHTERGYLQGYLTRLRELEAEQRIEIVLTQRTRFGSLFHESYCIVAWKPLTF